jgi:flagellar hook assembly protein FlgD
MPVRVLVYDALGRRVATLADEVVDAGRHTVMWDGRDATGQPVASGLYLYRMEAGSFSQTNRMMLIR